MNRLVITVAMVALTFGVAVAQTPEKTAEEEFTRGNTAYNLGRFDEAIDHFTKAYEAWPHPEFLYNIAQAYRLARNCKQALYFYKRFRSLKENDKSAPLSAKKRDEVDKFIAQLADCAAKAESSAGEKPDTIDPPPGRPSGSPSPITPSPAAPPMTQTAASEAAATSPSRPATAPANTRPDTALVEPADGDATPSVQAIAAAPRLISARVVSGVAMLGSGDLDIPFQPSLGLVAGYPLSIGPIILDLGMGLSYSPLPYQVMDVQKRGALLGVRAVVAATYVVHTKVSLRGELGVGVVSLGGLDMGNPLTTSRQAASFTLPNARIGIAADFAILPNLIVTASPLAAYSPGAEGLYGGSLRELDLLVGIGYRQ